MALFRREKDSIDEYRQTRRALAQSDLGETTASPVSQAEPAIPPDVVGAASEAGTVGPEVAAPVDPLDAYRQGATIVAKGTSFRGTLTSDSNLCIEGDFDGELEANVTVFIAGSARVTAKVRATDVIVAGSLDGSVDASGRFHAMPSARVAGEINSAILVVEQGSHVNCRFTMNSRGEKSR